MTSRHRIEIASPCRESWDEMEGAGPVRRCAKCDEDVHDLATLPVAEMGRLLRSKACLRVDLPALRRRAAPGVLAVLLTGCATTGQLDVTPTVAPYNGEPVEPETCEPLILDVVTIDEHTPVFIGRRGY